MISMIYREKFNYFFTAILCTSIALSAFSFQEKIGGIINKYGRVTGIGADWVIVNNPVQFSQFGIGDTVLVIQMKGVQAMIQQSGFFGDPQNMDGSPGKHEFLIIKSINTETRKITFRNLIINSFDISGDVQIIKTPSFLSAIVNTTLTCPPWDSVTRTGGVLSLMVSRSLQLNADIDVSGKGFLGGGVVSGQGFCVNSNPSRFDKFSFRMDSTNSGFKGESIVTKAWVDLVTQLPVFPGYSKGKGAIFTGGGGANGNSAGGGGGANYGIGGKGGRENNVCLPLYIPADGGIGGKRVAYTPLDGGIFLGGGGGSSSGVTGDASPGGNGGGIVILIADTIIGNNRTIRADGSSALSASGNAGSGGGGGGGSIAVSLSSFSTSILTVSARGGNGGNNTGTFGEGGGGGGGLIFTRNIPIPANVTRIVMGGAPGVRIGGSTATAGSAGTTLSTFTTILNGFLYNTIYSSHSGNQVDSVYSNEIPAPITGTAPLDGSGSYTFKWQRRNEGSLTYSDLVSANTSNYTFTSIETGTFYIRRIITDNISLLTDTSRSVKIVVMLATGIGEVKQNKQLHIYPNPAAETVNISFEDPCSGKVDITILNFAGQGVATFFSEKEEGIFSFRVPLRDLPHGIYYIRVIINGRLLRGGKIVKSE
jgi:hypothetical protein